MTPKGHGVIRGRLDLLYDPKGHGDLCGQFDLVYDPKRSRGIRGRRDLLYDPKGHGDLCGRFDLVYDPQKVTRSLEVAVTYFMTQKVMVNFVVRLTYFMVQKGQGVIRGQLDLPCDPKGQFDLWPWPWPNGQAFDQAGDHTCLGNTIM